MGFELRDIVARRGMALRFLVVSLINVVTHQVLLYLANSGWGWSGGVANAFAAVVTAIPGYLLSRYWVWAVRGTHSFKGEILPFWLIALAGLLFSTGLAEVADRLFGAGIAVALASLFGYFVVWVLKFMILDRLFERSARRNEEVAVS